MPSANKTVQFILILAIAATSTPAFAKRKRRNRRNVEQKKENALEKRLSEEQQVKKLFPFGFNELADQLVIISCEGEHGRGSGSGFIGRMDGRDYLFTNQHVILGADRIRFKTATGTLLKPRGVQLSTTLDIARLPLEEAEGLPIAKGLSKGAPIGTFGNSEGGGVATELYGKIKSLESDRFEVSTDFVSGNSGSPVINTNREVAGIATYVRIWSDDETGEKSRRFCLRLTDQQWMPVKWKQYNEKYGKLYQENEAVIEAILEMVEEWADDPYKSFKSENLPHHELEKWVKEHNHLIEIINRQQEVGRATTSGLKRINKKISNQILGSAESLAQICRNRNRHLSFLAQQRELSGYLRDSFTELVERLNHTADAVEDVGHALSKRDLFRFAFE